MFASKTRSPRTTGEAEGSRPPAAAAPPRDRTQSAIALLPWPNELTPRRGDRQAHFRPASPLAGALQTKLRVGAAGGEHERQADAVADAVARGPAGVGLASLPALAPLRSDAVGGPPPGARDQEAAIVETIAGGASAGAPLPAGLRKSMERSFATSFGDVRLHTGGDAGGLTRGLNARAFTTGRDIFIAPGEPALGTQPGRHLLAHELAHVVQQGAGSGAPDAGQRTIQRQVPTGTTATAATPPPQPTTIPDTAADQNLWRVHVDQAVRALFALTGPGLTAANTTFEAPATFASHLSNDTVEEVLFRGFLNQGNTLGSHFYEILDHNNQRALIVPTSILDPEYDRLRQFIRAGIAAGQFTGRSREYELVPSPAGLVGQPRAPYTITPQELARGSLGGVTDVSGTRATRTVRIQSGPIGNVTMSPYVQTLVHEACHFYVDPAFRTAVAARTDRHEWAGGAQIESILLEGFAEYFARQVMDAHAAQFGPRNDTYYSETRMAQHIVYTTGETQARNAYFRGSAAALQRVGRATDENKQGDGDLLIPPFIIDTA